MDHFIFFFFNANSNYCNNICHLNSLTWQHWTLQQTRIHTRLRFLCLHIWLFHLIRMHRSTGSSLPVSIMQERRGEELNSQMTSTDYQTGKGWEQEAVTFEVICWLSTGDEPPPHLAGHMFGLGLVWGREGGGFMAQRHMPEQPSQPCK